MYKSYSGDGADRKLPKTIVIASETVRAYFPTIHV